MALPGPITRLLVALLFIVASACTDGSPGTEAASTSEPNDNATTTPTTVDPGEPRVTSVTTAAPVTTEAVPQRQALLDALAGTGTGGNAARVGIVAHRASVLDGRRTIDWIAADDRLALGTIFAPEHGLFGTADAGADVTDTVDPITGATVESLYGERRAPSEEALADLDALVYDLQDVGVRAYTYIATLGLVMEAAAAADVPVFVVDRADPQGSTISGPILEPSLESFVSPYAVPTVYGLTSGELARLVVEQGWIDAQPDLTVIGPTAPLADPWIPPSPNLPTLEATWLYPALVPFEATVLSVGRGTAEPFTLLGAPAVDSEAVLDGIGGRRLLGLDLVPVQFVPESIEGMATDPRYEGQLLSGIELRTTAALEEPMLVSVELLDAFMDAVPDRSSVIDRPDVFDRLFGSSEVRRLLLADTEPTLIAATWSDDEARFEQLVGR